MTTPEPREDVAVAEACHNGCRMAAMEALIDRERPTLEAIEATGPAPVPDGEWTRPQYESYIADLRARLSHTEAERDDALRRERAAAVEALREAADDWQEGAGFTLMIAKPNGVPAIDYAQRVLDWLRGRADRRAER